MSSHFIIVEITASYFYSMSACPASFPALRIFFSLLILQSRYYIIPQCVLFQRVRLRFPNFKVITTARSWGHVLSLLHRPAAPFHVPHFFPCDAPRFSLFICAFCVFPVLLRCANIVKLSRLYYCNVPLSFVSPALCPPSASIFRALKYSRISSCALLHPYAAQFYCQP